MSYVRCVLCLRDPEAHTGKYGRYGNRAMVCKYCRKKTKHAIQNGIPLEVKFPQLTKIEPVIIDLFCGAGGFSMGFKEAFPGATFIGVDKNIEPCLSYETNIGHAYCLDLSIPRIVNYLIKQIITQFKRVDILIGSPPCQKFSGLNIKGKRDMDPSLINVFYKIKKFFKPRFWVMEESPFAARYVGRAFRRLLRACNYGLYHERCRLFAGNYPDVVPTRIRPVRHPTPTAEENHAFKKTQKHNWKLAKNLMSWFGHKISSWEMQILMGFSEKYVFHGNYAERLRQIGNAVCPPVSEAIARSIKAAILSTKKLVHQATLEELIS